MRGVLNLLTVRPRFWWTFRALEVCYVYLRQSPTWPLTLECHAVIFKYGLFFMNLSNIYISRFLRVYIKYICLYYFHNYFLIFWFPTYNIQKYEKSMDRHTWTHYLIQPIQVVHISCIAYIVTDNLTRTSPHTDTYTHTVVMWIYATLKSIS